MKRIDIEGSQVSRTSHSQSVSTNVNQVEMSNKSSLGFIFPLLDQITKLTSMPKWISFLVALFFYLQIVFSSCWPYTNFYRKDSATNSKVLIGIESKIFWFLDHEMSPNSAYTAIIVDLCVFVVCFGWFLFMIIFYQIRRRYMKWTLYPTRIIIEIICPLFVHPAAAATGATLKNLMDYGGAILWALFFVGVVVYLCFLFTFLTGYSLLCSSPIITTTLFTTFEPVFMKIMTITSSMMVFLSFLFFSFDVWVLNILQVVHFLVFLYLFVNSFQLHFHLKSANYLIFSVVLTSLVLDCVMFVCNLMPSIMGMIPLMISIVLFIVLIFVGMGVAKALYKNIVKKMSYNLQEGEEISSEIQVNLFRSLQIDTNKSKALMYLRIGLMEMTEPFLDLSLIKFIISYYADDPYAMCSLIQILSYFPSQQQLLNGCFNTMLKKKKLSLQNRFLIYQAYRIKTMRQSSIPLEANERMLHLRINTKDCEFAINSVWGSKVVPSIGLFETISSMTERTDGLWQEGIRDYPNNSKFSEDYCRFLTECRMDFKNAVIQKQRIDMIDNGHNFSRDYSFRSFIRNYPLYLKKKVVDTSGNLIRKRHNKGSSASNSSSQSRQMSSTSGSAVTIDYELEMMQARLLFSQSKLRMSLYNALKGSKLAVSTIMIITAVIAFAVALASFIAMNFLIKQWLYQRSFESSTSEDLANSYFYLNVACLHIFIEFILINQRINLMLIMDFRLTDPPLVSYVSFGANMRPDLIKNILKSQDYFDDFLNALSDQATSGIDVYSSAKSMFNIDVQGIVCYNGLPTRPYMRSMKDAFTDLYYDFLRLQEFPSDIGLYLRDPYCEIPVNMMLISGEFQNLLKSLYKAQINSYHSFNKKIDFYIYTVPVILFVIQFVPFLIVAIYFAFKMKHFAQLLIALDPKTKEGCRKPILLNADQVADQSQSDHIDVSHRWAMFIILHVIFSVISFIVMFFMIFESKDTNYVLKKINDWQYLSAKRFILSIELTHAALQAVIVNGSVPTNTLTQNNLANLINPMTTDLKNVNTLIMKGDGDTESIVGFDSILDEVNTKEQCSINGSQPSQSIHDLYRCASANQAINVLADMVLTAILNLPSYKGAINDVFTMNLLHMANAHLWYHLSISNSRLQELIDIHYKNYSTDADIFLVFGVLIGFIFLLFQVYCSFYSQKLYHTGLSLVRKIPPTQFVANKALLNFVLNRKTTHISSITCTSQSVIMHSNDGMIGVNNEGIIEIINPAITTILGYTPDQLLGQSVAEVFKSEDGEHVNQQMLAMVNGQGSLINEDHLFCISDNATEVPCHVFIIGLKGKMHNNIESFSFLIRDETLLVEQQASAEAAKAQSEALLFQILPRNIVTKLNRGEHDISFSVPSASIIFTDIVRFSDYSSNLTPAEVMGNLSQIFASFDEAVKQYPLITKIKLIGDIYMAAAGLFAEENTPPTMHAEQTVKFGLDCLQGIEDMNIKLDANLQLRIGINSGGPLLAGVLGSDKPVFDIIGDPINVAARLQTTDLPGRIQIPQGTYDLIANAGFLIEQRGEVFLKGKGKTMAYFVNPMSATFASMSEDQMNASNSSSKI